MENSMFKDEPNKLIRDAYDGKCIFVTGGTGFLGKVFVEKILYRCPKIAKIYVLMRDSEKASAEEKLKKMLDCPLFKRLKDERPRDLEKIVPIMGDICKPKLGINPNDENILITNVSKVFHFAATVKFNEPLNVALNINFEGTRRVLDLCVKIRTLEVFVYVSTAFSNGNRNVVDEVVYPPVMPLYYIDKIMKQTLTVEQTTQILGDMPNTYTMSKNLAENLVTEFHENHRFPAVIVRPSIVISCKDEPLSGWLDNWFGPTGIVVAISKGVTRAMCCDGNNIIDLIPVDYVSNVIIVAAARCRSVENVKVYNSCSSVVNPITLRTFTDIIIDEANKKKTNFIPLLKIMYIKSRLIMALITFLLETVPAYLADCVSLIIGKKNIHMKTLSRVNTIRSTLEPFSSRTWVMKSDNTTTLANTLSSNDSHVFACDAASVDWNEFIPLYLRGVEKYLLDSKK